MKSQYDINYEKFKALFDEKFPHQISIDGLKIWDCPMERWIEENCGPRAYVTTDMRVDGQWSSCYDGSKWVYGFKDQETALMTKICWC